MREKNHYFLYGFKILMLLFHISDAVYEHGTAALNYILTLAPKCSFQPLVSTAICFASLPFTSFNNCSRC